MEVEFASVGDASRLVQIFSDAYQDDGRTYFLYNSIGHASAAFSASLRRVLAGMTPTSPRQILKVIEPNTKIILGFLDFFSPKRKPSHGLPVTGWGGLMGLHLDEISGLNKRVYRFMTRKLQKEIWMHSGYWRIEGYTIIHLATDSRHQRRGIATKLVEYLRSFDRLSPIYMSIDKWTPGYEFLRSVGFYETTHSKAVSFETVAQKRYSPCGLNRTSRIVAAAMVLRSADTLHPTPHLIDIDSEIDKVSVVEMSVIIAESYSSEIRGGYPSCAALNFYQPNCEQYKEVMISAIGREAANPRNGAKSIWVTTYSRELKVISLLRLQCPGASTNDLLIQAYTGISRESRPDKTIVDHFNAKLLADNNVLISTQIQMRCDAVKECFELSGLAGRTYLELSSIATLEEYQKLGAATQAIRYVLERTKAARVPVYLVVQWGTYGHRFLKKQGFREVGDGQGVTCCSCRQGTRAGVRKVGMITTYPTGYSGINGAGTLHDLPADLFHSIQTKKRGPSSTTGASKYQHKSSSANNPLSVSDAPVRVTAITNPCRRNAGVASGHAVPIPSRDLLLSLVDWPGAKTCKAEPILTTYGKDLKDLVHRVANRRNMMKEKKVESNGAMERARILASSTMSPP